MFTDRAVPTRRPGRPAVAVCVALTLVALMSFLLPTAAAAASSRASSSAGVSTAPQTYSKAVSRLTARFRAAADTFERTASASPEALARASVTFGHACVRYANGLAALTAPPRVAKAQTILVSTIRSFAADLFQLAHDAARRDAAAVKRDTRAILALRQRLQRAEQAIGA